MLTKGFIAGCISASASAAVSRIAVPENWEAIEKYNMALSQTATVVERPTLLKPTGFAQSSASLDQDCDFGAKSCQAQDESV